MTKFQSYFAILILLLMVLTSETAFSQPKTYLGVIESFKETDYQSINPRIRVAFYLEDQHWHATPFNIDSLQELKDSSKNFPNEIHWIGLHQGKNLGSFSSQAFSPALYADIGIQKIIEPLPSSLLLPSSQTLQLPIKQFKNRPIIAISQGKDNNPKLTYLANNWSSKKLSSQEKNNFLQAIQKKSAKIDASYVSNKGDTLLSIKDNSTWYYLPKDSKPILIGTGLNLIDYLDLNHDGNTEWIFLYNDINNSDANTNGYILFYDDFKKSVKFLWNYH